MTASSPIYLMERAPKVQGHMPTPPFTSEVFAFRKLRSIERGSALVDWAEKIVLSGFESPHLNVLLGETEPFNSFEMEWLIDKIQRELKVPTISDDREAVEVVAAASIQRHYRGWKTNAETLSYLADLHYENKFAESLIDFFQLHYALDDLAYGEIAYHWDGATRDNIEEIIAARFKEWTAIHPLSRWLPFEWDEVGWVSM